jgi:hypothetical protein
MPTSPQHDNEGDIDGTNKYAGLGRSARSVCPENAHKDRFSVYPRPVAEGVFPDFLTKNSESLQDEFHSKSARISVRVYAGSVRGGTTL